MMSCRKLFVKGGRSVEKTKRSSGTVVEFTDGEVFDSAEFKADGPPGPKKPGIGEFYLLVLHKFGTHHGGLDQIVSDPSPGKCKERV